MTSWADVEASAPELAAAVRSAFAARRHATMATIRRDGSPRISGTEVDFDDDGNIYLGISPGARREDDLRRDPRVAIHCPTHDPPAENPAAWTGEGKITASAVAVDAPRFRLDIATVVFTKIAAGAQELEISVWKAVDGVTEVVRRS